MAAPRDSHRKANLASFTRSSSGASLNSRPFSLPRRLYEIAMAIPSDLIAHYSTKAFHTRISALSFVGAVLGAALLWIDDVNRSQILGLSLLVVVASLAELNRRFTYSYLCACRAAALRNSTIDRDAENWKDFSDMNEGPWRKKGKRISNFRAFLNRFLLTWSTYLPGLFAGAFLTLRWGMNLGAFLGLSISIGVFLWWLVYTAKPLNPGKFLSEEEKRKRLEN